MSRLLCLLLLYSVVLAQERVAIAGALTETIPASAFIPARTEARFAVIRELLAKQFVFEEVDLAKGAPAQRALLLCDPRGFGQAQTKSLDAYLQKGGRLLLCLTQGRFGRDSANRGAVLYNPRVSGLDKWLQERGLRIPQEFVAHTKSMQVSYLWQPGKAVPFPLWPKITKFEKHPAVAGLKELTLFWPHPVSFQRGTPLLRSHAGESLRWTDARRLDPDSIQLGRVKPGGRFALAVATERMIVVGNSMFASDVILRAETKSQAALKQQAAAFVSGCLRWLLGLG